MEGAPVRRGGCRSSNPEGDNAHAVDVRWESCEDEPDVSFFAAADDLSLYVCPGGGGAWMWYVVSGVHAHLPERGTLPSRAAARAAALAWLRRLSGGTTDAGTPPGARPPS